MDPQEKQPDEGIAELKTLKTLLEGGDISQEEVNMRKNQLINRITNTSTPTFPRRYSQTAIQRRPVNLRESTRTDLDSIPRNDTASPEDVVLQANEPITDSVTMDEAPFRALSEIEKLQIKSTAIAAHLDEESDVDDEEEAKKWEANSVESALKPDDTNVIKSMVDTAIAMPPIDRSSYEMMSSPSIETIKQEKPARRNSTRQSIKQLSLLRKEDKDHEHEHHHSSYYYSLKRPTAIMSNFLGFRPAKGQLVPETHEIPVIDINAITFSPTRLEQRLIGNINEITPSVPSWATVRWINCEGFTEEMIQYFAKVFCLHPLTVEDIIDIPQRPKMELYSNYLFFIFQIPSIQDGQLEREQVAMIVIGNTVITIQEGKKGDCWDEVRKSLESRTELRKGSVEFFIYSLVDALVDMLLSTVSAFGERIEDAEIELYEDPRDLKKINLVRNINRELLFIRGIVTPTHSVVKKMIKPFQRRWNIDEQELESKTKEYGFYFSPAIRTYIQDIDDNLSRVEDMIDTYKEICKSLDSLHESAQDHIMNQTMFLLAIVSTIFLPLTFLAGVYGMNFEHFPELKWKYAYLYWWIAVFVIVGVTSLIIFLIWKCMGPPRTRKHVTR